MHARAGQQLHHARPAVLLVAAPTRPKSGATGSGPARGGFRVRPARPGAPSHQPGDLLAGLVQPERRRYADRMLDRTIDLPNAFEHPAPPSAGFLRWLIEHPEQLRWPERSPGVRVSYGAATQRHREALVDGSVEERDAAQALALAEPGRDAGRPVLGTAGDGGRLKASPRWIAGSRPTGCSSSSRARARSRSGSTTGSGRETSWSGTWRSPATSRQPCRSRPARDRAARREADRVGALGEHAAPRR